VSFLEIFGELSRGVGYTVLVTLACAATGMAVGLAVAGLRRLALPGLGPLLTAFTYVFRGVPVLVLLFLVYFGLPGIGLKVQPLAALVLSLGLVAGAYLSEVFRGALDAVDPAEVMAAEATGLSRLQTLVHIEMPQMLRFSVPGMVNEFTSILKYSPFAYTVGIPEITKQAMTMTATSLQGIEVYLAVGLTYFAIYRLLLAGVHLLERWFRVPGLAAGQA
jgi:polar amino acid transport system permease protein